MGTSVDVLVGATGIVSAAPSGTALPTDPTTGLNGAFTDLGFVSEDGVAQSIAQDTTEIKAWGGSTIRKIQTSHTVEYKLALLETNPDALGAYYGTANVDTTFLNAVTIVSETNERQSWVIDVVDGTNLVRIVIPDGEVTAHEDVTFKTDSAISYGITITAYEDSTGVKAYQYFDAAGIS